jgi:hypothetical protein
MLGYNMSIELKIKAKHLALEPAIIRKEEQKVLKHIRSGYCNDAVAGYNKYVSLRNHRVWNVRNEARATNLARAYLAGKHYETVEQKRKPENEYKFQRYIVPRIAAMAMKYGKASKVTDQEIIDWTDCRKL